MESNGIMRMVDELGRVVLPIEYRSKLGIEPRDKVKLVIKDNGIFLKKVIRIVIFVVKKKAI